MDDLELIEHGHHSGDSGSRSGAIGTAITAVVPNPIFAHNGGHYLFRIEQRTLFLLASINLVHDARRRRKMGKNARKRFLFFPTPSLTSSGRKKGRPTYSAALGFRVCTSPSQNNFFGHFQLMSLVRPGTSAPSAPTRSFHLMQMTSHLERKTLLAELFSLRHL